jgi:hypothetical protein
MALYILLSSGAAFLLLRVAPVTSAGIDPVRFPSVSSEQRIRITSTGPHRYRSVNDASETEKHARDCVL